MGVNALATRVKKRTDTKKWMVRIVCLSLAVLMIGTVIFSAVFSRVF